MGIKCAQGECFRTKAAALQDRGQKDSTDVTRCPISVAEKTVQKHGSRLVSAVRRHHHSGLEKTQTLNQIAIRRGLGFLTGQALCQCGLDTVLIPLATPARHRCGRQQIGHRPARRFAPDHRQCAAATHAAIANAGVGYSQRAAAEDVEHALAENA